jgi:hypothetical protein
MAKTLGYNVGHKMNEDTIAPGKEYKNRVCYPTVYLSDVDLPYLKGLEVGDKVSFLCLFEITGIKQDKNKKWNYDLDLQKVAEESEMKISKALEKFLGSHEEAGDKGGAKEEKSED